MTTLAEDLAAIGIPDFGNSTARSSLAEYLLASQIPEDQRQIRIKAILELCNKFWGPNGGRKVWMVNDHSRVGRVKAVRPRPTNTCRTPRLERGFSELEIFVKWSGRGFSGQDPEMLEVIPEA